MYSHHLIKSSIHLSSWEASQQDADLGQHWWMIISSQTKCDWGRYSVWPYGFIKYAFQVSLGKGRTFQILVSSDLLWNWKCLFIWYRLHSFLPESFQCCLVFSEIKLRANQYYRNIWRMMFYFWIPLCFHIVEWWRTNDGKTDEEHVSLWIRQWSESVIILLASRIPQPEAYWLPINHDSGRIVVEPEQAQPRVGLLSISHILTP